MVYMRNTAFNYGKCFNCGEKINKFTKHYCDRRWLCTDCRDKHLQRKLMKFKGEIPICGI